MKTKQIIVTEAGKAELQDVEVRRPGEHEVLVAGEASIVSPGTELSIFTGSFLGMPFPNEVMVPRGYPREVGYGHVGAIAEVGPGVERWKVGDRVLTRAPHGALMTADTRRLIVEVPKSMPAQRAVFARILAIAISALRSSTVEAGDKVLVFGGGLVGNLTAQVFKLAGADVAIASATPARRKIAQLVGIRHVFAQDDLEMGLMQWTAHKGPHCVVDATGMLQRIEQAVMCVRRCGEVILLGTPRGPRRVRRDAALPAPAPGSDPRDRRSGMAVADLGEVDRIRDIDHNYRCALDWIQQRSVDVSMVVAGIVEPERCQQVYESLAACQGNEIGAIYDWRSITRRSTVD